MVRPFVGGIGLTVLFGTLRIVLSLVFVWLCKTLIDIVTGISEKPLDLYIGILLLLVISRIVVASAASYVEHYNVLKATNRLRFSTFSHVLSSKWYGKETFLSGDVVNRLEEDVRVVVDVLVSKFPQILVTLFQLVAASLYLMTLSPNLMWILVVLMILAVLCSKMFFRKIRILSNTIRTLDASLQQAMQENIQNRILVLTLFGIDKVLATVSSIQESFFKKSGERLNLNTTANISLRFGFMAGYASAFIWGILGIKDGTVTYGMMTAFLQLVNQIQIPILDVSRQIPSLIHSISSIERLMELMELSPEKKNSDVYFDNAPAISVKNIRFSYPGSDKMVFKDFSFDFPSGRMTVISGHTGSGKSTLVKILLALLEPSSGEVLIDGVGISPDTRCNFMYVPQGNTLMSGTIRENLLLANPDATEQQMTEALRAAVADFVFDSPDGLDTLCSEDGAGLSEGQSQRIAIARALLHKGNILILDESTSSLDVSTETKLLKNIFEGYHFKKTIIFISHRESVFEYADARLHLD